jgi:hypothetical protein
MQLSKITAIAIVTSMMIQGENYVSLEYLQYDENDNRVSVSAPSVTISHDFGTDFNLKLDYVHDAITGATPIWSPDSGSGASARDDSGDYTYKNRDFSDGRNAYSALLTTRFENRDELYTGIDYSRESDFDSKAISVEYLHYTDKSHNRSLNVGVSYADNEILSQNYDTGSGASQKETSTAINADIGMTQILDKTSSLKAGVFTVLDDGYLNNPYSTVVREYGSENQKLVSENRPDSRVAYGVSLKYIKLLRDDLSYQGSYRYYRDDWDIDSHTIDNSLYYELNKSFTFGLGLRYYNQSEADFYNEAKDYFIDEKYASSDERLSQFDALTYRASVDFKQNDNISYNLGGQFYSQSTGLDTTSFTIGAKYKY